MTRNPVATPRRFQHAALLTLYSVLCLAAPARAQFDSAQLSGIVRDTTGGVLPGVDVTLTSVGTGLERRAVTNESGLYTFTNVPVGEYKDPKDPSKTYTTTWFDMWRIKDGKADEHWDSAMKNP